MIKNKILLNPKVVALSETKARNLFNDRFLGNITKTKNKYARFDGIDEANKMLLEVKNRGCISNTYPTSMFPATKIKYWKKHYPDYKLFFVCCYKDGEFYYEFNDDDVIELGKGGRYDRGKAEINEYYYIPLSLFKKFN